MFAQEALSADAALGRNRKQSFKVGRNGGLDELELASDAASQMTKYNRNCIRLWFSVWSPTTYLCFVQQRAL